MTLVNKGEFLVMEEQQEQEGTTEPGVEYKPMTFQTLSLIVFWFQALWQVQTKGVGDVWEGSNDMGATICPR